MKTAAVSKLKACLSEYIASVKQGEEVLVLERGKPVARIVPIAGGVPDDQRRAELIRQGIIRPGKGSISLEWLRSLPKVDLSAKDLARIIEEEREDRV